MTNTHDDWVIVNGEAMEIADGGTLPDLLRSMRIDPESARGVAVAVNEEVVPRRHWASVEIRSGDRVEVVTAKQGG